MMESGPVDISIRVARMLVSRNNICVPVRVMNVMLMISTMVSDLAPVTILTIDELNINVLVPDKQYLEQLIINVHTDVKA